MIRLLLTSGRGPAECRIAVAKTLDAMRREAEAAGLDFDSAAGPSPDGYGPASAIVLIQGEDAQAFAAQWIGSILWVAQSPVRPHCKRKNWFVGIFALTAPPARPAALDPSDVRFESFRAGGPGGQHQNKTESAVRAVHKPTGHAVVVRDGRSQHRNKAIALQRLAAVLALADDLAASNDRRQVQSGHDRLERGRPMRRFTGENFKPASGN
ncbi:MAG: peptide chain release factor H [Hyphomicrobiaceae bacterium]